MIGVRLTDDWARAIKVLSESSTRINKAMRQAELREAHLLRAQIIRGLDSGAPGGKKFTPHAPLTIVMRRFRGFGGSKILIQSAAMRNSVTVVPLPGGGAFVGVHRKSMGKGKKSPANIARIQEFGVTFTMPMTARMRRFLFVAMRKANIPPRPRAKGAKGASTITIRIRARPFIRPAIDQIKRAEVKERFRKAIEEQLRF